MHGSTDEKTQQRAARIAGFVYLLTMATSIAAMAMFRVITKSGDASEIVRQIQSKEVLFRGAMAVSLGTWLILLILPVALYVVLRVVDRNLALLGLLWRFLEIALLVAITLYLYPILDLAVGTTYTEALSAPQIEAQLMLHLKTYGAGFNVAMVLLSLGSLVFYYLFYKSRYVPRFLSGAGIFGCIWVIALFFWSLLLPNAPAVLAQLIFLPLFFVEVALGFWLLVKGVRVMG